MSTTPDVLPIAAPASGVPGPAQGAWTYADYAAIPDDGNRYEIIDGVLYMTPAPNFSHQNAVAAILVYLRLHVDMPGLGKVVASPIDVELSPGRSTVQPDVVVILNEHQQMIVPSRIIGAPDLVVEVASASTATYDRRGKMDAYAAAGVREYWIADPATETVELFCLSEAVYQSGGVFHGQSVPPSRVLEGFAVPVERFFA